MDCWRIDHFSLESPRCVIEQTTDKAQMTDWQGPKFSISAFRQALSSPETEGARDARRRPPTGSRRARWRAVTVKWIGGAILQEPLSMRRAHAGPQPPCAPLLTMTTCIVFS